MSTGHPVTYLSSNSSSQSFSTHSWNSSKRWDDGFRQATRQTPRFELTALSTQPFLLLTPYLHPFRMATPRSSSTTLIELWLAYHVAPTVTPVDQFGGHRKIQAEEPFREDESAHRTIRLLRLTWLPSAQYEDPCKMHDAWYFPRGYADFAETSYPGIYILVVCIFLEVSTGQKPCDVHLFDLRQTRHEALIKMQLVQM
ncbi:hypothetical protein SCHPADRAFT_295262 [Schizopora paradoxa]|uniref:Uncharacterized protein n=1 Tax=Schizopora paradoxa TaxID=27342 RepID=A0A0H2SD14_9AGAM|nr:hypothetical protein SCHPADRAFT_295262 [Schizopora paradoxa]